MLYSRRRFPPLVSQMSPLKNTVNKDIREYVLDIHHSYRYVLLSFSLACYEAILTLSLTLQALKMPTLIKLVLFLSHHIFVQHVCMCTYKCVCLCVCIQVPVGPPSEVEEIFDAISYAKGSCVIRMLHDWIGEEVGPGLVPYIHIYIHTYIHKSGGVAMMSCYQCAFILFIFILFFIFI